MIMIEDKANQQGKHELKHLYFEKNGIYYERYPLPVGDYIIANDNVLDVIARKQKRGIEVKKMDFLGTYNVCVDTKKDMQEIVGNVCGNQHARFRDECILAQNNGIKLYVLVENNDDVTCIDDVFSWVNPRLKIMIPDKARPPKYITKSGRAIYPRKQKYPKATRGKQLALSLLTMEKKYGVTFEFCRPDESGKKIVEILTSFSEMEGKE